ncbi:hypothetical protein C8Q77DRAFT_1093724 [Trametes polyzona]|nr:hypothetical protein C8Q77DRAFT_1093724 [Trametes polyzona]
MDVGYSGPYSKEAHSPPGSISIYKHQNHSEPVHVRPAPSQPAPPILSVGKQTYGREGRKKKGEGMRREGRDAGVPERHSTSTNPPAHARIRPDPAPTHPKPGAIT